VKLDPAFLRPAEVDHLIGDASKARQQLGWSPSVDFPGLVKMMVDADLERHAAPTVRGSSSPTVSRARLPGA